MYKYRSQLYDGWICSLYIYSRVKCIYIYKSQDPEAEAIDDGDAAREAEPVSAEEAIQDILQS